MSQTESPPEVESDATQGSEAIVGLTIQEAVLSVWKYWVAALISAGIAAFFFTNEVWGNDGEIFYVIIFSAFTVIFLAAGVAVAHRRTRDFNF